MKRIVTILTAIGLIFGATACSSSENSEREKMQAAKSDPNRKTLEKANLAERIKRQEVADKIGYVYIVSFAQPMGYYVIKGKVSNAGSQLTPEDDVVRLSSTCCESVVTDGVQDDGTYGTGDPGIFFFTSAGTMVETSLDYVYSDQPLDLDVPLLAK